jgi:hypothetical protein
MATSTAEPQVITGMSKPHAGWAGKTAQGTTELVMPSLDPDRMLGAMDSKALLNMASFMDKMFFDKKLRSEVFIKTRESADSDAKSVSTSTPSNVTLYPLQLINFGEKLADFPNDGKSVVLKEFVKLEMNNVLRQKGISGEGAKEFATAVEKFAMSAYRLGKLYMLERNEALANQSGPNGEVGKALDPGNVALRKSLFGE